MNSSDVDSRWLRKMIAETGVKHHDVAEGARLGHVSIVSKILRDVRSIKVDEAARLIDFFENKADDLQSFGAPEKGSSKDFVSIPRFKLALSGGGGREIDEEAPIDVIPFTKDFVRRRLGRRGVHQLIMVDAAGDSMEPLIHHNDLLMIDLSERALDGSIMGFRYQGAAMLKRLTKTPEGILVSSENPSAPSFTIASETEEDFRVYGRVCWIGRTV
ncbi:MAG: S24 family peptidase [Pseudomonadota bacterium]